LANASRKVMNDSKYEYLFVDEISMVHEHFYKFFITLRRARPELKFIVAGDFLQLLPVNDRVDCCDYKNSPALYELCDGQRLQLTKCRRSDDTHFKLCDPINIPNLSKTDFNKSNGQLCTKNLCFTNIKRKEINNTMMTKYIEKKVTEAKAKKIKQPKSIDIKAKENDETSQDVRLMKGMPIIAKKTTEKYDIMNNETFDIIDIKEDIFTIKIHQTPIEIELKEFQDLFNIAFCMTIHKSQGQTFDKDYNIYEWEKLDNRLKYVALSRSTDVKNIYIN